MTENEKPIFRVDTGLIKVLRHRKKSCRNVSENNRRHNGHLFQKHSLNLGNTLVSEVYGDRRTFFTNIDNLKKIVIYFLIFCISLFFSASA